MLFNSYTFIFAFLPLTVLLFHWLRTRGRMRSSLGLLVLASLVYYSWWNPKSLILLLGLILLNFGLARAMLWARKAKISLLKPCLIAGITANLGILGYYKYTNFFIDNVNFFLNTSFPPQAIVLPLGISFFTFQKIALLTDIYQNKVEKLDFLNFALFVTFFPQLIAGPITHHSEVIPQFNKLQRVSYHAICLGVTIFIIGLAKKVILADGTAKFASFGFNAAAQGQHLDFLAAWSAALTYTLQIYFDFSGYSDMAIGIGQMFGIRLPLNFNSPYKSKSIIEFWQRWHMTLSRFLRDYLYIPLGGNRHGPARRYINLLLTMLLGGIWHGADWTFAVWGLMHGMFLALNHAWNAFKGRLVMPHFLAQGLTFIAVVTGWVFFRASGLPMAWDMIKSMTGLNGFVWHPAAGLLLAGILLLMIWIAPNTQEMTGYAGPAEPKDVSDLSTVPKIWQPTLEWAVYTGFLLAASLMMFSRISEFIYFRF
jgi:alginate O-acetyltransferase complex protein AlgI